MTKGELLNAIADMPNDADVILYIREWGLTTGGIETFIGKYVDLTSVQSEVNEYGEATVFLEGDDD